MSTRSRKGDPNRCAAQTVMDGKLTACDRPARWTLTITARSDAQHLIQDVVDLFGPQGRCEEHAQQFLVHGDRVLTKNLIFEIQPRSQS